MKKQTELEADISTWNGVVPRSVTTLPKVWKFDLLAVLAHLAVVTRPPGLVGFDLSDYWTILRYGYAFLPDSTLSPIE